MLSVLVLLFLLGSISQPPIATSTLAAAASNLRVPRELSGKLVFPDNSVETASHPSNNEIAYTGRNRVQYFTNTTTLGPRVTYRGRAPPMSTTQGVVTSTTTTVPTPAGNNSSRWYERLVPTAVPRFFESIGGFFGKKKTTVTTTARPTSTTTPLLETDDPRTNDTNGYDDELDDRILIDAPSISEECPSGMRIVGTRCRRVMS